MVKYATAHITKRRQLLKRKEMKEIVLKLRKTPTYGSGIYPFHLFI